MRDTPTWLTPVGIRPQPAAWFARDSYQSGAAPQKPEIFSRQPATGNRPPRPGHKRNFATIVTEPSIPDILVVGDKVIAMERTEFEPFGEKVKLPESAAVRGTVSGWLLWTGSGLFWILAGTIVIARAIYFDPRILDGFGHAVALLRGVFTG
jgi:hypothetical protein